MNDARSIPNEYRAPTTPAPPSVKGHKQVHEIVRFLRIGAFAAEAHTVHRALMQLTKICQRTHCLSDYQAEVAVIHIMKYWINDKVIQIQGCNLFWKATQHTALPFSTAAVKAGVIQTILLSMQKFETDEDVQNSGLCTIRRLLIAVPQGVTNFVKHEIIIASVQALQRFPNRDCIQQNACFVLAIICHWGSGSVRRSIVRCGGNHYLKSACTQGNHHLRQICREATEEIHCQVRIPYPQVFLGKMHGRRCASKSS
jgi:hypothetical protein